MERLSYGFIVGETSVGHALMANGVRALAKEEALIRLPSAEDASVF